MSALRRAVNSEKSGPADCKDAIEALKYACKDDNDSASERINAMLAAIFNK